VHRLLQLGETQLGETMLVQAVALREMFAQHAGGPLAKARGTGGIDPVADGDDRIKVVVSEPASDPPGPFLANYRVILGRCRPFQLFVLIDVLEVQADVVRRSCKQISHLGLGDPQCFSLQPHFDLPRVVLEDDNVAHAGLRLFA